MSRQPPSATRHHRHEGKQQRTSHDRAQNHDPESPLQDCPVGLGRRSAGGEWGSAPSARGPERRRAARSTGSSLDELGDLRGDLPRGHDDGTVIVTWQDAVVGLRQDLGDGEGGALEGGWALAAGQHTGA